MEKEILKFNTHNFGLEGKKNLFGNLSVGIPQTSYTLTDQRLIIENQKMIGGNQEDIELHKIKDIKVTQGLKDKALGVGDIEIHCGKVVTLKRIKDALSVKDTIRQAMLDSKENRNVQYREEI